jgi:sulfur-carrier protein
MKVNVPAPLRSYTGLQKVVEGSGTTLGEVLAGIDHRYPGFRFRIIDEQDSIREHIKIFVNEEQAANLRVPVDATDTVHIICALSGGRRQ